MTTVTIHEAKTHLSRLIKDVLAGQEVVIARGKVEVAKLVAINNGLDGPRTPGRFANTSGAKGILDHGFWEPLDDEDIGLTDDTTDLA